MERRDQAKSYWFSTCMDYYLVSLDCDEDENQMSCFLNRKDVNANDDIITAHRLASKFTRYESDSKFVGCVKRILHSNWAEEPPVKTPEELWDRVLDVWEEMAKNLDLFRNLVDSMPRRMRAVVDTGGLSIGYIPSNYVKEKESLGLQKYELHQLLVYADDVNMLGENPQIFRENTGILLEASKDIGLEVNPEKTKYMIMSRDQNIVRDGNIKIGNLSFEKVEMFRYLRATVTNINDTRKKIKRRINVRNACYYSVGKILSSNLLSKNPKVRIYKTIILPVVLYGCETWTLTLREEQKLRVFENKELRKIFGAKRDEVTGEWRKLHNVELHALYS
ncbi:hypothetical protein ANN_26320 [Periplaneta americana]|uniref:Reverse transcriptase domain-containing protein n=1 Tax=Periplaneta americana TaxID=6978 RepID=A0ABQ8S622_PERAM|nr:hypothetical protein ANN_26320 [Periplaneta americana]